MSNILLAWKDPVTRDDGTALAPDKIARVEIAMRAKGAPSFTPVTSVASGVQKFLQTDLPPGDYEFSIVVVDTQVPPKPSAAVILQGNIPVPELAAPGPVTDATLTVEP